MQLSMGFNDCAKVYKGFSSTISASCDNINLGELALPKPHIKLFINSAVIAAGLMTEKILVPALGLPPVPRLLKIKILPTNAIVTELPAHPPNTTTTLELLLFILEFICAANSFALSETVGKLPWNLQFR